MLRDYPFNIADQKIIFWQILAVQEPHLPTSSLTIGSASMQKEMKAGI
jgi:hypothetical protein